MWGTFKCFICKEEGHKAADCSRNKGPTTGRSYVMHVEEAEAEPDTTLITEIQIFELAVFARGDAPNISTLTVQSTLRDRIRAGQSSDEQLQKWRLRDESKGLRLYYVKDVIVRYRYRLWVPGGDTLREDFIKEAHEHQRPAEKLKQLPIHEWKLENITKDFVTGLPRTVGQYNAIWVIFDRLTKSAHILPIKKTFMMTLYMELYIIEIVRLNGIAMSIVLDRDTRFKYGFWKSIHQAYGTYQVAIQYSLLSSYQWSA
ncbi:uncharacterized protein LOC142541893 [Primulina tabacum]|uniref:uncharacterized protein LOC142541893 n=1 Tax=Primulina tabacum TaxID=48773 RepID=UPI003F5A110A